MGLGEQSKHAYRQSQQAAGVGEPGWTCRFWSDHELSLQCGGLQPGVKGASPWQSASQKGSGGEPARQRQQVK